MNNCELTKSHQQGRKTLHTSPFYEPSGMYDVLSALPVGVNCEAGDPFQPDQELNTLAKLAALEAAGHRGPVALLTKWDVSATTLRLIARFNLDLFVFYSITGLRESRQQTQENTLRSYLDACRLLPQQRVAVVVRPIIPDRNDTLEVLAPILDAVREGQRLMVARGFRDRSWRLLCNEEFMAQLSREADDRGIRVFNRTACLVAAMHGSACKLHDHRLDEPGVAAATALGYELKAGIDPAEQCPMLTAGAKGNALSMGDMHFLQLLTGVKVFHENPIHDNQLNVLRGPAGISLNCSSSWFSYTRTVPCQVGCFYCETTYRPHVWGEIGCVPSALADVSLPVSGNRRHLG